MAIKKRGKRGGERMKRGETPVLEEPCDSFPAFHGDQRAGRGVEGGSEEGRESRWRDQVIEIRSGGRG